MELNPCLNCFRRDKNKNHPICRDCNKRIDYVIGLEMTLNFTASYGDSQASAAPISFFSRGQFNLLRKGDAVY